MSAVLIVADSLSDRALFRTILSRAGYTVQEVLSGREVLAKVREVRPHVVVLDVNLLDMDGHSVCRTLRAAPDVASVPVLMLLARDNDADILASLDSGADDYVAKDSDPEILLARVRRLIEFRRLATVAVLNEHLVQIGRLLAGIVHEIRGPLSVIRGSAELMRLQLPPNDPCQQWLEPILRNAQLLQVRLEYLMATVRSGPPQIETLPLGPVIREATAFFIKGMDPRGGQITLEAPPPEPRLHAAVDAGRLIQVLLTLFSNAREAILATRPRGRITVRPRTVSEEGRDWAVIEVADNGPGIKEEYLERIFEPGFTIDKEQGTGFGLYLATENLLEQGGRLTVRNEPEGGACFTIWLPATPAPSAAGVG